MISRKLTKSIPSFHIRRQLKTKVVNLEPCNCVLFFVSKRRCSISGCLTYHVLMSKLNVHKTISPPAPREGVPTTTYQYSSLFFKQRKDTNTCSSCCPHSGFSLVHYLSMWSQFSWPPHSLSDRLAFMGTLQVRTK